jgi:hypothetical protein
MTDFREFPCQSRGDPKADSSGTLCQGPGTHSTKSYTLNPLNPEPFLSLNPKAYTLDL